jgi:hypothetical protein
MTFDNYFEVRPEEMGFLEFTLIQYLQKAQNDRKIMNYTKRNIHYCLARLSAAINSASKKLF